MCKTLISQEIIKLWSWFCTCNYKLLDPTNWLNHFAFVSSGKLSFSDDNNYVTNGNNGDHNDDNNFVDYNNSHEMMLILWWSWWQWQLQWWL